jgi:hypothetical protein
VIAYLSSPNNALQASAVKDMPVLLSFMVASQWIAEYVPTFGRLLLDCGAYTAYAQGRTIDGAAYKAWSSQYAHWCDAIAGIDDIGGDYRASLDNYDRYGGFPTYHDSDPPELLDDLVALAQERGGWIGIGLKPPREGKEDFIRRTCDRIPPDLHVHGWALRAYTHISRIDSVDSTNWFRDAMDLRAVPLCSHLTCAETLEIVIKRYQRWTRKVRDPIQQDDLFAQTEDNNDR